MKITKKLDKLLSECRKQIAGNPNTLPETLSELAEDGYWSVRAAAIGNPNYKK